MFQSSQATQVTPLSDLPLYKLFETYSTLHPPIQTLSTPLCLSNSFLPLSIKLKYNPLQEFLLAGAHNKQSSSFISPPPFCGSF